MTVHDVCVTPLTELYKLQRSCCRILHQSRREHSYSHQVISVQFVGGYAAIFPGYSPVKYDISLGSPKNLM